MKNTNTDEGRKEVLAKLNEMSSYNVDGGAAFSFAIGMMMGHLNTGKKNFSIEELLDLINDSYEYGLKIKKADKQKCLY